MQTRTDGRLVSQPMSRAWALIAMLSFFLPGTLFSDTEYLDGEFWTDEDRIIHADDEEDPEVRVLMEGRHVFSGMLYGYDFRYVPSDRTRQVEEEFSLQPVARIPWGDQRLRVISTRRRPDDAFVARLRYDMAPFQRARYEAWRSNTLTPASGAGTADLLRGFDGKISSIEEAVKQAIRNHVRGKTFNKPRVITGRVLLREPPRIGVASGEYVARVETFLIIDEVVHYTAY
ncbi:MAG: hypothetical protein ACLFPW_08030 [Spirochaetaceae bacterium]